MASSSTASSTSSLWADITRVYDRALQAGDIQKTETQLEFYWDSALDVEYVIRVAEALNRKPKGAAASPPPESTPGSPPSPPPRNPFLPYEEALWVRHLSPSHTLLLNKFNVVPHHVLVVTRVFESQQDPLNRADLGAAWEVLQAMPSGGVAFYNCGEHSGRSQPHKHVQVVPLPFAEGRGPHMPMHGVVQAAAEASGAKPYEPFEVRALPYRCYTAKLDTSATPELLEQAFDALFERCGGTKGGGQGGAPAVSYNVLLSRELLVVAPRRQECAGRIAINSLGFAGTVLVRSQEDVAQVRSTGPTSILAQVGQPW